MDKSIYLSGINSSNLLHAQAVHANNLANINTNGFKANLVQFKSQEVPNQELKSRFYSVIHDNATDFANGSIAPSDRALDLAINGDGWFAVQTPAGEEVYTRTGNFKVNNDGVLATESNLLVLGDGGTILIPENTKLEIGNDGTISVQTGSGNQAVLAILDRLKLVNPDKKNLIKGEDGLVRTKDKKPAEPDSTVSVIAGGLESSNVNAIFEITSMISLARQFEVNLKIMDAVKENEQLHNKILSLS